MTVNGWIQIVVFLIALLVLVKPLGSYIAAVFQGERVFLSPILSPLERFFYRLAGVNANREMDWKAYAVAMLIFSFVGLVFLYLLLRFQGMLPLNPQHFGPVSPTLSLNTSTSFVTNTNWQNYSGEQTLSNLTQMLGLTVQNFLSAATGLAILAAFIRGFARRSASTLGNFWVDLTRSTLYILLPIAIILAFVLVSQGVVQTLSSNRSVAFLNPVKDNGGSLIDQQVLALGPVASQVAIKHLGTNGGGFFNTNAAHPFENPTPLTDFLLILSESAIPAALTYTFGKMVGDTRQGWAILTVMLVILVLFIGLTYFSEVKGNPQIAAVGVDQTASNLNPGGNMEGKEVRFGISRSVLFAATTTATSTGAVDSMHDSYLPLGGLSLLVLMQLGEVALGGIGSGLYGMLVFVIVAVFVAGLMVGRTPEYLGKKIEVFEMKMAALLVLIMPILVLGFTAVAAAIPAGVSSIANPGAHGFSEILYAFTSQGNNNGSAMAGLNGNTLFYHLAGSLAMFIGRFWLALPTLALAGSLAKKKRLPVSGGTLPTHTPLFILWLTGVILLVGALNFVPALALGPIFEHLILFGH